MKIDFFVPSYKRCSETITSKWLESAILCVHQFEEKEYKEHNKNKILVIPDNLRGNMAKVRNFILNKCKADVCVMLDDDVKEVGYHENLQQISMSQGDLYYKIQEWAHQAQDMGTVLFGINLQSDPKFYREYSPISTQSPVLGTFCCILKKGNKIKYDERLGLNEDYDYSLQVLFEYHKILRWNKFYYVVDHLDKDGGCGAYRLMDEEIAQAEIMQEKWGKYVRYNFEKSTNPRIRSPFSGI